MLPLIQILSGKLIQGFLIAVILGTVTSSSFGDTVEMKDGRQFVGNVIQNDASGVVIDTMVSGIRVSLDLAWPDILEIYEGELPKDFYDKKKTPPSEQLNSKNDRDNDTVVKEQKPGRKVRYWEVPLEGTFGVEIQASGVADALEKAVRQKIQFVIFRIKSDGGSVDTARKIVESMKLYDDQLDYIAVVERGISASIWVVFSCDYIFVYDYAALGGAVVYTKNTTTGDISVDAKMNSALAALVAGRASSKGHSPDIVRAMMILEASAYTWKDKNGHIQIASEKPLRENGIVTLDTDETVLTLTGTQAAEIGLARLSDGTVDGIGNSLGVTGWRNKSNYGRLAMNRAYEAYRTLEAKKQRMLADLDRRPALIRYINANTKDAVAADPDNFVYYYEVNPETGVRYFTNDSWDRWYANTDAATSAWRRVLSALNNLSKIEAGAAWLGVEQTSDAVDLSDHGNRAAREINRLLSNRARGPRF